MSITKMFFDRPDPVVVSENERNPFEKWLGQQCIELLGRASRACEPFIRSGIAMDERISRGVMTQQWDAGDDENVAQNIAIPLDSASVDTVTAAFIEQYAQTGGYRVIANGTESQDVAEATKAYMDAVMGMFNAEERIRAAFNLACIHDYVGVLTHVRTRIKRVRKPIAIDFGQPVPEGHVVTSYSRLDPQTGQPEKVMVTPLVPQQEEQKIPEFEVIPSTRLYFSSPEIPSLEDQPSVHVLYILDKNRIKDIAAVVPEQISVGCSGYNVAKEGFTGKDGSSVGSDERSEAWHTWLDPFSLEVPEDITDQDYLDFLTMYKVPRPFQKGDRWCIVHDANGFVLAVQENPQIKQDEYPIAVGSFYPNPRHLFGRSLMHCIHDVCVTVETLINVTIWALNKRMTPTWFYSAGSAIDATEVAEALRSRFRGIKVRNAEDVMYSLRFLEIPNTMAELQASINILVGIVLQRIGVPDTMMGMQEGGTATEAQISSGRANVRMSLPFRNFVMSILKPTLESFRDCCLRWSDIEIMTSLTGEQAGHISRQGWIYPDMLTDQFEIAPMFSYEFMIESRMTTVLMGVLKMFSAFGIGQATAAKIARRIMQSAGMTAKVIDETLDDVGKATDIFEEIRALSQGPDYSVKVREDDNHRVAITAIQAAKAANPEIADWRNVKDYEAQHTIYLMAEMAAAEAQQMAKAGMGGPERRDTEGRMVSDLLAPGKDVPMSDAGMASAEAQGAGFAGGDMTDLAQGGMTGMGAV